MARAFVYNEGKQQDGTFTDPQEIIQLGFFFDGTTNNMYNTDGV